MNVTGVNDAAAGGRRQRRWRRQRPRRLGRREGDVHGVDTTPPTVTATSPAPGATGVAVNTNVTATFSEAMTASTLTTATVTLVPQGSTTPVAATVTYAAATNTVTLDPTADLAGSTVYTATIKGGRGGREGHGRQSAGGRPGLDVHDGADRDDVTYLSDRAWTTVENGWGPVEKDRSNGETAADDGGR